MEEKDRARRKPATHWKYALMCNYRYKLLIQFSTSSQRPPIPSERLMGNIAFALDGRSPWPPNKGAHNLSRLAAKAPSFSTQSGDREGTILRTKLYFIFTDAWRT